MDQLSENLRIVTDVAQGRVASTTEQRTDLACRMIVIHERLGRETAITAGTAAALGVKHLLVLLDGETILRPEPIAAAYFRMVLTEARVFGARAELGAFDAIARADIARRNMASSAFSPGEI